MATVGPHVPTRTAGRVYGMRRRIWRLSSARSGAQDAKVGKAKLDDDLDQYFAQKDKKAAEVETAAAAEAEEPMAEAEAEAVAA